MVRSRWSEAEIPDQEGRVCLVTGANSGLGFEIARALAEHGAHVALACRDPLRGADAASRISERQPTATVEVVHLDLGDLRSVETASAAFAGKHDRLDLLINNAGIAASVRSVTAQGFEAQLGVNHLGSRRPHRGPPPSAVVHAGLSRGLGEQLYAPFRSDQIR